MIWRKKIGLVMLLFCFGLELGAVTYNLGYVLGIASSTTFTISGGVYPGAPSYTVWRESNYYYAKNIAGALSYSGTNASQIINAIMDGLLADEQGGKVTVVASPEPIAAVLGYVANNTHLEGIGELQITSPHDGEDEFIMREGSTLTNVFIKHENRTTVLKYEEWSSYFAIVQQWSDFPSNGGVLENWAGLGFSTHLVFDGDINTEGAAEIIGTYFRVWPVGNETYGIRVDLYGTLDIFDVATGERTFAMAKANVTGAVNSVTVPYEHGRVLREMPSNIQVTPAQNVGDFWVSAYTTTNVTIGFENQPGGSTWYFFVQAWCS